MVDHRKLGRELEIFHSDPLIGAGLPIWLPADLVGSYVTSLNMSGCSLTLIRADDELTDLWDQPVRTPGLCW
jgi:phosphoenolpyruvate---glycerone phosphotransferase subunit DhaK